MDTSSDPVVIEEVVKISMDDSIKSERAEFAAVVFHNIPETYSDELDVQVCYTVTADLVPTTRDWVGLYKVGWMYPKDYLYYEWAPTPINYRIGYDGDASLKFPANKMPDDDGEFYQFCYVSSSGQIRGASTPFQFRRPGSEDFVEIEDEEEDIMVIRTKSVYLQENLQQAEVQKSKLMEAQEALQKERDDVILKYQEVKKKLSLREKEVSQLESKLVGSEGSIAQLKKEAKDLVIVRDELENKLKDFTKQNKILSATIDDLKDQVKTLKDVKKRLEGEKDDLSGRNAVLGDQVEMLKNHSRTTETSASKYSTQIQDLEVQLAEQLSIVDQLRHKVDALNEELEKTRQDSDRQLAIHTQDKDRVDNLTEKLRNAEDKLQAAEESKVILQKEIATYSETQEGLSRQVEHSTSEANGLKQKLCDLEEDFDKRHRILESEMDQVRKDLLATMQEKEKLQEQNSNLEQKLSSHLEMSDAKVGSISIMKLSLNQIKERLEKKEKQCKRLEKTLNQREREFMQTEHEMKREVEDLKDKIYMCSEEYKALYIEKSKVQKKLDKMQDKRKHKQVQRTQSPSGFVVSELVQTSTPDEKESDMESTDKIETQVSEIERELEKELEHGLEKKLKYKKLYVQEKERGDRATMLHAEQLKEKDEEIDRLKKRVRDIPSTWDLKVRTLENCVSEKEKIIEGLNIRLRQSNQGRNDETGASMSTHRTPGPVYDNKYPPYMVYPNAPHPWLMYPHTGPLQYPHQSAAANMVQPPPLAYPIPTVPTGVSNPPSGAEGQQVSTCGGLAPKQVDEPLEILMERDRASSPKAVLIDKEGEKEDLDEPLTPLPPPLEPVKLPSAKKAAVLSEFTFDEPDGPKHGYFNLKVDLPEVKPSAPMISDKEEKEEKERFYDAEGMAMRFCPECGMSFSADVNDQTFEDHQLSHVAGICPVCKLMKDDDMSADDFARHVNKHYDSEGKDEIY